jgi:hypothetical protein
VALVLDDLPATVSASVLAIGLLDLFHAAAEIARRSSPKLLTRTRAGTAA